MRSTLASFNGIPLSNKAQHSEIVDIARDDFKDVLATKLRLRISRRFIPISVTPAACWTALVVYWRRAYSPQGPPKVWPEPTTK